MAAPSERRPSRAVYVAQSALLWGGLPVAGMYLPVYLEKAGMTASQIGFLTALSPAMAIVLPGFIGVYADRSPSKNRVLLMLTAGGAASVLLYPWGQGFVFFLLVGLVLSSFQAAQAPLSEAITLEGLARLNRPYGPVRLAGTFGFAAAALLAGWLVKLDVNALFYLTGLIVALNLITVARLPKVPGHQADGVRVPVRELFHDRPLVLMLGLALACNVSLQVYNAFFGVYFIELGGSADQLGLLLALMAVSELPFLLGAERLLAKVSLRWVLLASMGIALLRFGALTLFNAPLWMYPLSLLNGLTFIVFAYSLATYIARNARKELRASGQTVLGIATSAGRVLGSVVGGLMAQTWGLRLTFAAFGVFTLVSAVVYGLLSRGPLRPSA